MFQWDAVNTSPDLGDQNVLKTCEMAIHHNRLMTWTELETGFCRWIYFHLCSKIFLALLHSRMHLPPSVTAFCVTCRPRMLSLMLHWVPQHTRTHTTFCVCCCYSHEHIEIVVTKDGDPVFFRQRDGPFFPSLRLLHKCKTQTFAGS